MHQSTSGTKIPRSYSCTRAQTLIFKNVEFTGCYRKFTIVLELDQFALLRSSGLKFSWLKILFENNSFANSLGCSSNRID